jgi:hypothetical protein
MAENKLTMLLMMRTASPTDVAWNPMLGAALSWAEDMMRAVEMQTVFCVLRGPGG